MKAKGQSVQIPAGKIEIVTYDSYSIGDEVHVGDEEFYVLEASDSRESTVTLFAKYNLSTTATSGHYMQAKNASYSATACQFSNDYYWSSEYSNHYQTGITYTVSDIQLDLNELEIPSTETLSANAILKAQDYAEALGGTDGRLLKWEEMRSLRSSYADMIWGNENQMGTSSSTYGLNYWLGSAAMPPYTNGYICVVWGQYDDVVMGAKYDDGRSHGVRPVIIISKSKVSAITP